MIPELPTETRHRLKVLTFTSLYPNAANPRHGVFVENRLRHLVSSGAVELRVVAPVPWVPPGLQMRYRGFAAAPQNEQRDGFVVDHPRYPVIPKFGMTVAPWLMYRWAVAAVARVRAEGFNFDLIDAHYFYPDGVAAVMLGRRFNKPVAITARGSDINVIARFAGPRRQILWAASRAAANIAVSRALKDAMVQVGVPSARIEVLRNGVDLRMFRPANRAAPRQLLGIAGPILMSVGNLVTAKGHDLVVRALIELPGVALVVVGAGPERAELEKLARRVGVGDRVQFLGERPHGELAELYSAADVLVLASASEGWPNVLLEAMACGTPVVASDVGGVAEIVAAPEAGRILHERTPAAIAAAVKALLAAPPSREATRSYAEKYSWDETTKGQIELFTKIVAAHSTSRR
jgi:glycosyltransferase involved in cell wall biosynthesis